MFRKRVTGVLMALAMSVSLFSGLTLTAKADEDVLVLTQDTVNTLKTNAGSNASTDQGYTDESGKLKYRYSTIYIQNTNSVRLDSDIDLENLSICWQESDAAKTLDLNGHSLVNEWGNDTWPRNARGAALELLSGTYAIKNGMVSVIDARDSNITLDNAKTRRDEYDLSELYDNNTVTINSGEYGAIEASTVIINGGTFQAIGFSNATINGGTFEWGISGGKDDKITLKGGTYKAGSYTTTVNDAVYEKTWYPIDASTTDTSVIMSWLADGYSYSSSNIKIDEENSGTYIDADVVTVQPTGTSSASESTYETTSLTDRSAFSVPAGSKVVIRGISPLTSVEAMNKLTDLIAQTKKDIEGKANILHIYNFDLDATGSGAVNINIGKAYAGYVAVVGHYHNGEWTTQKRLVNSEGIITPSFSSFSPMSIMITSAQDVNAISLSSKAETVTSPKTADGIPFGAAIVLALALVLMAVSVASSKKAIRFFK